MHPLSDSEDYVPRSSPGFQEDDHRGTNGKLHNLQQEGAEVAKKKGCSMQELAAIIGRMNQMARTGIHPAPIFNYQPCIHHMPTQEGTAHTTRQVQISLNLQALEELPVVDLISDFTAQWCSTIHVHPPPID